MVIYMKGRESGMPQKEMWDGYVLLFILRTDLVNIPFFWLSQMKKIKLLTIT